MAVPLPDIGSSLFLSTCGIETTLIYLDGIPLPYFASFDLLRRPEGPQILQSFYRKNVQIASEYGLGIVLDTPTWRASEDWGLKLQCSSEELRSINSLGVLLLKEIRQEAGSTSVVISGCVGPRGDGYTVGLTMRREEAEEYHRNQITALTLAGADVISAITMTYPEEAIGIVNAGKKMRIPVIVSFTVETDGNLPSGHTLETAIDMVDSSTESYPTYYMINCAHPSHFPAALFQNQSWSQRVKGVLVNASKKSHAELNDSTELDAGDVEELASDMEDLKRRLPQLRVLGGCCGTDYRHIREIAKRCATLP